MARKVLIALALLLVSLSALTFLLYLGYWNETEGNPRRLMVGDTWTYKVLFPDGKSYQSTETVIEASTLNGTHTFVIFRDDAQHISTEYLWITADWHEVKTFKPQIGNMLANSTEFYSPPLEIFQVPFHVGNSWEINSTLLTTIRFDKEKSDSSEVLFETRETVSLETVVTPAGQFSAYKTKVRTHGNSLSEILWFDARIGYVVYGEYYNQNEKVTQTLVSFRLATSSGPDMQLNLEPLTSFNMLRSIQSMFARKLCNFASYIYHNLASSSCEMKMHYE